MWKEIELLRFPSLKLKHRDHLFAHIFYPKYLSCKGVSHTPRQRSLLSDVLSAGSTFSGLSKEQALQCQTAHGPWVQLRNDLPKGNYSPKRRIQICHISRRKSKQVNTPSEPLSKVTSATSSAFWESSMDLVALLPPPLAISAMIRGSNKRILTINCINWQDCW